MDAEKSDQAMRAYGGENIGGRRDQQNKVLPEAERGRRQAVDRRCEENRQSLAAFGRNGHGDFLEIKNRRLRRTGDPR